MARAATIRVGDLVARADAPAMVYRVESKLGGIALRLLPYQRSGNEVVITRMGGVWTDGAAIFVRV